MMREFLTIFKVQLKVTYGLSAFIDSIKNDKKKLVTNILIILSILIGIGSFGALIAGVMYGVYVVGASIGRPELVLMISFLTTQMVVFFFGIFFVMGTFYFSNDISILMPLPVKPSNIIASKLGIVAVNEYLTVIPVFLPAVIIFGIGTGAGLLYYIKSLVIILASPFLPLLICAIFNVFLMNYANPKKSRDLIAGIGGFLAILLGIGWNFVVQKYAASASSGKYQDLIKSNMDAIDKIGSVFPPAVWVSNALKDNSLASFGYFLLFLAAVAVITFILLSFVNKVYFKSIMSGEEVSRKRKSISRDALNAKFSRQSSQLMAIFKREFNTFFKTPVYLLNGISSIIFTPIILLMPFINNSDKDLVKILGFINNPSIRNNVLLGIAGVLVLMNNLNIIANTAISREGKMFWISKMIPVDARTQINAKLMMAVLIEFTGIILNLAILSYFMRFNLREILLIACLSFIASLFLIIINLTIDVLKPKLNWTNPQEAVKQNLNTLLGMLLSMLILGLCAGLVILFNLISLALFAINIILAIFLIALTISFLFILYNLAENKYKSIEV